MQQQQQQQQQMQFNLDLKGIMALLEENNSQRVSYISQAIRQDMVNMCPNTTEEQGYLYSSAVPEASAEEILWDGLWNMDEAHGNLSVANKAGLYNLVAPFC